MGSVQQNNIGASFSQFTGWTFITKQYSRPLTKVKITNTTVTISSQSNRVKCIIKQCRLLPCSCSVSLCLSLSLSVSLCLSLSLSVSLCLSLSLPLPLPPLSHWHKPGWGETETLTESDVMLLLVQMDCFHMDCHRLADESHRPWMNPHWPS